MKTIMNRLARGIIVVFLWLCVLTACSQDPTYEVYALRFTEPETRALSYQVIDASDKETYSSVFMFWLLKGSNGKKILVDAGFQKDSEVARSHKLPGYVRPDSVLLRLGIKAEEVTDIILSHPHWDHADGVDLFSNAKVWIQKEDYEYFVGTAWQAGGLKEGFDKRDVQKLVTLNLKGNLMLVDGDDKEIFPGIKVYTGSRHTFNSQYVLVSTGSYKIIIASDNAKIYYNLDHMKSVPANATFDTKGYVNAMGRMKSLAPDKSLVIPGHDALVFKKFPAAGVGIVRIR